MARIKYTMLFNYASNTTANLSRIRVGGWSESVYGPDGTSILDRDFNALQRARAALLPQGANIVGQRYQIVDGTAGRVRNTSQVFEGAGAKYPQDVPQMGLLFSGLADGSNNLRRWKIAALPDERAYQGEYFPDPTGEYDRAISAYKTQMQKWYFRHVQLSSLVDLLTISSGGVFVLGSDPGAWNGPPTPSIMQVMKTITPEKRKKGGKFYVLAKVDQTNGTLRDWPALACRGGKMRVLTYTYSKLQNGSIEMEKVVQRKIGRPPVGYVGRASIRR